MGFNLKKITKAVNPVSYFATSPFTAGKSSGPANPYGPVDTSYLRDPKMFEFLRKPNDNVFNDLIGKIGAPSSVDVVRGEVEGDMMKRLMEDIGIDEKQETGSLKMDFLDRGLGGPGQLSDIEAVGLAQARGNAGRRRAAVRTTFANSLLDRLKEKETAMRDAYLTRYNAQNQRDLTWADLVSGRDVSAAQIASGQYSDAEERRNKYAKPSILEELLRNIQLNVGPSGG